MYGGRAGVLAASTPTHLKRVTQALHKRKTDEEGCARLLSLKRGNSVETGIYWPQKIPFLETARLCLCNTDLLTVSLLSFVWKPKCQAVS